jgi:CRP-like cAMP-binding protein
MSHLSLSPAKPANRILAHLPAADYQRLVRLLRPVPLKPKQAIYQVGQAMEYIYFPTSGIVSAMTVMKDGRAIEVATIGNEGMTGLTAFMGGETSSYEVMVQIPGDALRMKLSDFHDATRREGSLRDVLVRYNAAFAVQVSYSVACNGLHKVEQRCCRWLLMTQDRVGSNVLPLTHEFLAIMLGVRRASITEVLRPLQINGVVRNRRANIEILDRSRLEQLSCECYQAVVAEYERLLA